MNRPDDVYLFVFDFRCLGLDFFLEFEFCLVALPLDEPLAAPAADADFWFLLFLVSFFFLLEAPD